ncbi:MAG: DNA translocase FtsK 4TM domain-containing protein [Acidobacteriota bacterium]
MNKRVKEISGVLILGAAIVLLIMLLTYNPSDPSPWNNQSARLRPSNWFGRVGANISETLFQFLGFSSLLIPFALFIAGWNLIRKEEPGRNLSASAGFIVLILFLASFLTLLFGEFLYRGVSIRPGGYIGERIAFMLLPYLNWIGATLISLLLIILGIVISTQFSLSKAASLVAKGMSAVLRRVRLAYLRFWENRRKTKMRRDLIKKQVKKMEEERETLLHERKRDVLPEVSVPKKSPIVRPALKQQPLRFSDSDKYQSPPLMLLNSSSTASQVDEKELMEKAKVIADKLKEFDVTGSVVQIHPGPVVTTFEFKPEAGIKYARITSLVDDLCLALKAESIRIDRIAGKSTVGIEVPNRVKEIIYPRELLSSEKFQNAKSKLTLAIGKTIDGDTYVADLEKMPHLLIAGATGTGKSVALNNMITSILYKATPEEVKFILIDTKMLELGTYQDIPHLLIPVVTDPKQASVALKWATKEMENRYKQLALIYARNIEQFNQKLKQEGWARIKDETTSEEKELKPLPFIVIVIDELADLMMVSSIDVEESIMRLAQMARAVGIHLILATQRPSVDVITGIIKANFPARIAFRVSQKVDSRTIIDQNGAEQLLGMGDMLFLLPSSTRLMRLHGGFITEQESKKIADFLRKQGQPTYNESVLRYEEAEEAASERSDFAMERDSLYREAVRLVVTEGQASISHLQRRLRLGYARAARIIDMMEDDGIVGPADGSKPREVLVGLDYLDNMNHYS